MTLIVTRLQISCGLLAFGRPQTRCLAPAWRGRTKKLLTSIKATFLRKILCNYFECDVK